MKYFSGLFSHLTSTASASPPWRGLLLVSVFLFSNFALADYFVGIPTPPFDPNMASPTPPSSWPNSSEENSYYVDNTAQNATDTNNPYGHPDLPRATIPSGTTFGPGTYIEIHGGPYDQGSVLLITADGTRQNPVWIRGLSSNPPTIRSKLVVLGSYIYVENLKFDRSRRTMGIRAGSNNIMFRWNVLSGPQVNDGNTAAIGFSGKSGAPNSDIIIFQNEISNFGDTSPQASENDYHGMKGSRFCSNVWILENHVFNMAGDSVQIGDASMPDSERCTKLYIANNNFHDNRENAVDIKNAQDVIIAGNHMANFVKSGSSGGTALVVHNGADNVWIIGNKITNSEVGISNTGGTNVWVIANQLTQMTSTGTFDPTSYYGRGVAIHYRGDSSGGIVNNTLHGNQKGIQLASGQNYEITGNIFSGRTRQDAFDIMLRTTSLGRDTLVANNLYSDFAARISSTEYYNLDTFSMPDTTGLPSIEGDPMYRNAIDNDFRLLETSPAIDTGSESGVYTTFRERFGLSLSFDLLGDPRPTTSEWNLGAFESFGGITPERPTDLN